MTNILQSLNNLTEFSYGKYERPRRVSYGSEVITFDKTKNVYCHDLSFLLTDGCITCPDFLLHLQRNKNSIDGISRKGSRMALKHLSYRAEHIIDKAKSFGASLVGITHAVSLRNSPSDEVYGHSGEFNGTLSILVMALAHEAASPELDWWDNTGGGTPGNRMLISISRNLVQWLMEHEIQARDVPYHVEKGGIFLKEAAVLSGIGIVGRNNLLVTPEYGPRVRLRAVFIDMDLESTGLLDFNPCESCSMPCRKVCPRNAFISGFYSSSLCYQQMTDDEANAVICEKSEYHESSRMCLKYCRSCELACPVGVSSYG